MNKANFNTKRMIFIAELHYLSCLNEDCEIFSCVARRDYEGKISVLENHMEYIYNKLCIREDSQNNFGDLKSLIEKAIKL